MKLSFKLKNGLLASQAHIKGGVFTSHNKNTAEFQSVIMPPAKQVSIAMQQHIGAPCIPCVKKGDKVFVGTVLGDSESFVSAPIHSSVSGEVYEISEFMLPNGAMTKTVVINTDGAQTVDPNLTHPVIDSKESFLKAVKNSGLVGLGGAGFPAHVKLNPKQKIDTLIINAAECEPYITADYREIMECCDDVVDGICLVLKYLNIQRAIIVIEDNKPNAIELLKQKVSSGEFADNIYILPVKSKYPGGAEKVTVYAATGRKIPVGKLPADVGTVVMNVSSVATISRYAKTGMPLCNKRVTIDGSAITNPQNVIVAVGTYIKDIIEFTGGYKCESKKLLMGGPMMGIAVPSDDLPILKQNNAILALDEEDAYPTPVSSCIRCGRCGFVCPMSLMPTIIESHLKIKDIDALKKDGVMNCIECGCCAFKCPASRPLVQAMREAKSCIRKVGGN